MKYTEDELIRIGLKQRGKTDEDIDILLADSNPEPDVSDDDLSRLLEKRGLDAEALLTDPDEESEIEEPVNSERHSLAAPEDGLITISLGSLCREMVSQGYSQCLSDVRECFGRAGMDVTPILSSLR